MACTYGYKYVVMKLIEVFPEAIQHQDFEGYYPLHKAITSYALSEDVVMKLIAIFPMAVSISTEYVYTALHLACKNTFNLSKNVVRKLIEIYPFAIQEKDNMGRYPLFHAIRNGHHQKISAIKLLLDSDPSAQQPVHHACASDDIEIVEYMMQRSDLQINARDNFGMTPLHSACFFQERVRDVEIRIKIVQKLLDHPFILINVKTDRDKTILDLVKS